MLLLALVLTGLSGCVLPFGASRKVMPGMVRVVGRGMSGAVREARGSEGPDRLVETARLVRSLSIEQKVAQLFFVRPESLVRRYTDETVTATGEVMR